MQAGERADDSVAMAAAPARKFRMGCHLMYRAGSPNPLCPPRETSEKVEFEPSLSGHLFSQRLRLAGRSASVTGTALRSRTDGFEQRIQIDRGDRHLLDLSFVIEGHMDRDRQGKGLGVLLRRAQGKIAQQRDVVSHRGAPV